jgi:hypothetical protein
VSGEEHGGCDGFFLKSPKERIENRKIEKRDGLKNGKFGEYWSCIKKMTHQVDPV